MAATSTTRRTTTIRSKSRSVYFFLFGYFFCIFNAATTTINPSTFNPNTWCANKRVGLYPSPFPTRCYNTWNATTSSEWKEPYTHVLRLLCSALICLLACPGSVRHLEKFQRLEMRNRRFNVSLVILFK